MIVRGNKSIGMSVRSKPPATLPGAAENPDSIMQELALRLQNLETLVERKADSSSIKSLIAISPEAVKIQAKDIVLAGTVTIADVFGEYNGTDPDKAPAKITRIRGDVIQTGTIKSNNYGADEGSAWDLDNETIVMGGSDNPKFKWDGTDLEITGALKAGSIITESVTIGGTTLGTIKSNAGAGYSHATSAGNPHNTSLAQINGDLDDIADGSNYYKTTYDEKLGGFRAKQALDSDWEYIQALSTQKIAVSGTNPLNGIVIDSAGFRAYASGSPTVTISATTGASSWSGDITTSGRVIATGGETYSGVLAAMHAIAGSIGGAGLYAHKGSGNSAISADGTSGWGVLATSTTGVAVSASTSNSFGKAIEANNSGGGTALSIPNGSIIKPRKTGHLLQVWDASTGTSAGIFEYEFRT